MIQKTRIMFMHMWSSQQKFDQRKKKSLFFSAQLLNAKCEPTYFIRLVTKGLRISHCQGYCWSHRNLWLQGIRRPGFIRVSCLRLTGQQCHVCCLQQKEMENKNREFTVGHRQKAEWLKLETHLYANRKSLTHNKSNEMKKLESETEQTSVSALCCPSAWFYIYNLRLHKTGWFQSVILLLKWNLDFLLSQESCWLCFDWRQTERLLSCLNTKIINKQIDLF